MEDIRQSLRGPMANTARYLGPNVKVDDIVNKFDVV